MQFVISDAQMADIISRMSQAGESFRAPIFRAARGGLLSLAVATRGERLPRSCLQQHSPALVVLADDLPTAQGPETWPQARRLTRWASLAILHGTGGETFHYDAAVGASLAFGRVLMVEMEQRHHAAWLALIEREAPRLKVLSILPPAGDCHPRMTAPAGTVMQ